MCKDDEYDDVILLHFVCLFPPTFIVLFSYNLARDQYGLQFSNVAHAFFDGDYTPLKTWEAVKHTVLHCRML